MNDLVALCPFVKLIVLLFLARRFAIRSRHTGPFPSYFYGLWQRGCDPNEPDEYKLLVDVISIVTGPPYVDPRDEFMSPSPEDDDDDEMD